MKQFVRIAAAAAIALSLAGCAGLQTSVFQGGASLTADVANPITRRDLYQAELALYAARRLAVQYIRLPRCRLGVTESFTNVCSRPTVVRQLKAADRAAAAAIREARRFVGKRSLSALDALADARAAITAFSNLAEGAR